MAVEILRFRRLPEGNIQRLRNVQLPGLAICAQTAVVVDAVGDVGVLLNFRHHDALADGVQRAGGDEEAVPFVHRHSVQHVGQGVILNAAFKLLLADLMGEAVVEGAPGSASSTYHISVLPYWCSCSKAYSLEGCT